MVDRCPSLQEMVYNLTGALGGPFCKHGPRQLFANRDEVTWQRGILLVLRISSSFVSFLIISYLIISYLNFSIFNQHIYAAYVQQNIFEMGTSLEG